MSYAYESLSVHPKNQVNIDGKIINLSVGVFCADRQVANQELPQLAPTCFILRSLNNGLDSQSKTKPIMDSGLSDQQSIGYKGKPHATLYWAKPSPKQSLKGRSLRRSHIVTLTGGKAYKKKQRSLKTILLLKTITSGLRVPYAQLPGLN